MALEQVLSLIESSVVDSPKDISNSLFQNDTLQSFNTVRNIVRMVELELSGFQFMEASHFRFGLNIARAHYQQGGLSVIREKDVETFRRFLRSNNVDRYGKHVKTLLEGIIGDAASSTLRRGVEIEVVTLQTESRRTDNPQTML